MEPALRSEGLIRCEGGIGLGIIHSIWQTLLILSLLVVVHEFGHFITARMFGVKVYEFAVGFGPVLWKTEHKGIQYSIRWILLGGFCKIAGMDIALEGEEKDEEPLRPEESFNFLALWKKIVVIAAGPIFNLVLAIVLVFCMAAFVGLPDSLRDDAPIVEQALPGSPAFDAGVRPGDRIVAINDQPVNRWQDISALVQKYGDKPLTVKLVRDNQTLTKTITPMYNELEKRYIIGINPVSEFKRTSVGEAVKIALKFPWGFTESVIKTFQLMFTGKLGGAGLMGPIGMISIVEQNANLPLYYTLYWVVQISMFLFLFNMLPLPLPLLDGGWIVILLIERLLRREFTPEQKAAAQMFGMVAVLLLGAFIAYGDILRFVKRFFGG